MIFLFLLSVGIPSAANPTFCTSCHNHPWVFTTLADSPHKKVTCKACHTPPDLAWADFPGGVIEYFIDEAVVGGKSGLYMLLGKFEQPLNYESFVSLHMRDSACERCHVMENRPVTPTRGLIIDHKIHKDNDIGCATCHNRVAHSVGSRDDWPGKDPKQWREGSRGYANLNSEYGCLRCHRETESAEGAGASAEEGGGRSVVASALAAEEEPGEHDSKSEGGSGAGEGVEESKGGEEHGGAEGEPPEKTPHDATNQHDVNAPTASPKCEVCHRGGVL